MPVVHRRHLARLIGDRSGGAVKLRRPNHAEIEATVFLALTFAGASAAAVVGALVDRRLNPRCSG